MTEQSTANWPASTQIRRPEDAISSTSGVDPRHPSKAKFITVSAIVFVALVVRLVPVLFFPSVAFPDEIFQTLEQAHRLVFGFGSVPWEFQYGTRSWLLPGILAGLMRVGAWIGGGEPVYYLAIIHGALAALSAGACACAYLWGRRFYGSWGGIIAAAVPVLWPDNVYFGARTLFECVAAPLLVIGIYLIEPGYRVESKCRLAVAGALLGLAVAVRLQVAPAVAAVLLWMAFRAPLRQVLLIGAGMVGALLASGGLDAATWGYPFASMWRNLDYNLWLGVSSSFGDHPWYFYPYWLLYYWNVFVVVIPLLALYGASRVPSAILATVAIIFAHSLIPHKELRFIYPAILLLTIASGLGAARIFSWVEGNYQTYTTSIAVILITMITLSAAFVGLLEPYMGRWHRGHEAIEADLFVSRLNSACGVGIWGGFAGEKYLIRNRKPSKTTITDGGYAGQTYLHRNVPVYMLDDVADVAEYRPAFNTLVTTATPVPPGFSVDACFGTICISQRLGKCELMQPKTILHLPAAAKIESQRR